VKTAQETDDIIREWGCDAGVMYVERYRQGQEAIDKENARVYFDMASGSRDSLQSALDIVPTRATFYVRL
jgi:hypothetical protein